MEIPFHINVPIKMLIERIDEVIENRINPEVYVDAQSLKEISPESVEITAEKLKKAGIKTTLHAPYMDLNPGARDEDVRKITVDRILSSIKLTLPFEPIMIVCHPGYFDYNYSFNYSVWAEKAYRSFSEIGEECSKNGLKIAIENVFERNPDNLCFLLSRLPSEQFGFCFDPGHANLFTEVEMKVWLEALGERLFEMHIHDNRGKYDEHLPVGDGNIRYEEIFRITMGKKFIFTLEPHKIEDLKRSISNFLKMVK
jgi:sugar phosphate isomerase/epimerase